MRWLDRGVVVAIHAQLIAEHGGLLGVRDAAALEGAIARPLQAQAYADTDLADLAAAYGYGLCRNHAFVDGNKRIALATIDVFLRLQGHALTAGEVEAVSVIRALAAGELSEAELAAWVRSNMTRL